jgi:hypothetical protein
MDGEPQEESWEALSAEILSGMREWRLHHPKATLREIEQALDHRWYRLRADGTGLGAPKHCCALEGECHCRASCLPSLWQPAHFARQTPTAAQNLWWTLSHFGALLWPLPKLQKGSFSPWMRNWLYCQGNSLRSCKTTSLTWGAGCRLPKRRPCSNASECVKPFETDQG